MFDLISICYLPFALKNFAKLGTFPHFGKKKSIFRTQKYIFYKEYVRFSLHFANFALGTKPPTHHKQGIKAKQ